jgi:hypothetical protein
MATGIVYSTQAELEEKVKEKIFPNRRKGIKGEAHQQAVLDMIASLWRSQTSGGINSVNGPTIDNADPANPIVGLPTVAQIQAIRPLKTVGGVTIEGPGDIPIPAQGVQSVTGDGVDNTDPDNPVLSYESAAAIKSKYESNVNTNGYTDAEKSKLAGLESSKFVGQFSSLSALQTAFPTASIGSYAYVDQGVGQSNVKYIWDDDDTSWVEQGGVSAEETPSTIKAKYESNPDTNAYTDAEKANLANQSNTNTGDETNTTIKNKRPLKTVDGSPLEGPGNVSVGVKTVTGSGVDNTDPENPVLNLNFSETTFTNTVDISTLTVTREVYGSQVRLIGNITLAPGTPSLIRNTISDVIPANFNGKTWFRLTKVSMVHNITAPVVSFLGANGYLELSELSTFNVGSLSTLNTTTLQIPGVSIGYQRSYSVDGFNQALGVNAASTSDRIESSDNDNYITASPKYLVNEGFDLGWISPAQSNFDYGTFFQGSTEGINVSFVLEGILI